MANYTVISTDKAQQILPNGKSREVYRVLFQTTNGSVGSVDISPADWNKETIQAILAQEAANLDLAFDLNSLK